MRIKVHKMMSKKIMLLLLFVGFQLTAQNKKWTLEECVDYAIKNNISILILNIYKYIRIN